MMYVGCHDIKVIVVHFKDDGLIFLNTFHKLMTMANLMMVEMVVTFCCKRKMGVKGANSL